MRRTEGLREELPQSRVRGRVAVDDDPLEEVARGAGAELEPVHRLGELAADPRVAEERRHLRVPRHHPLARAAAEERAGAAEVGVGRVRVVDAREVERVEPGRQGIHHLARAPP